LRWGEYLEGMGRRRREEEEEEDGE